jgi:hypothetical protein
MRALLGGWVNCAGETRSRRYVAVGSLQVLPCKLEPCSTRGRVVYRSTALKCSETCERVPSGQLRALLGQRFVTSMPSAHVTRLAETAFSASKELPVDRCRSTKPGVGASGGDFSER